MLSYTVEVQLPSGAWAAGGGGSARGHKRIHVLAAPVAGARAVRLNVTGTIGVDPAMVRWVALAAVDGGSAGLLVARAWPRAQGWFL